MRVNFKIQLNRIPLFGDLWSNAERSLLNKSYCRFSFWDFCLNNQKLYTEGGKQPVYESEREE